MAGKAVVKPAKKPAVKKAKATGKAVAKKPAVVKKPAVKAKAAKAVVKKPTGAKAAKFNFNKLIMLIIRDVPKKGKKMTGGYKKDDVKVETIKKTILDFLTKINSRIIKRINEFYVLKDNHKQDIIDKANKIGKLLSSPANDTNIKEFIEYMNGSIGSEIINKDLPTPEIDSAPNYAYKEMRVYNVNLMIIVKALCEVYFNFHNYAEDIAADIMKKKQISEMV